ncbi:MAG: hypothetical protein HS101_08285 [Planctomycetia bacterium]|jgi:YD repeat-containing protein|nr:hypothetical protein [Planctomycetia bacterium]OQZ05159.1 MAG: hypothetical protein B6D36_11560 [Planctomycetes bacterium UTPLA1]
MQTYTIYFPDPEDPPVSMPSGAYHYLHDALGSVIGLVDAPGELVERYTYDPYGKVFIEKWDAAVGLYATLYRTYSLTLGKTVRNPRTMRMRPS